MRRRVAAFGVVALALALAAGFGVLRSIPARGVAAQLVIGVIGDYGCQSGSSCTAISSQQEQAVANLVHGWSPDAIFTVGDNSYENGSSADVKADQQPYATDVTKGIFYPVAGNHDWANQSADKTWYPTNSGAYFNRPAHYVAHLGSGLLDFFSTDMNPADPDGDSASSVQASHYQSDVAASTAIWKVTGDHQAFYSSGAIGSQSYTHWAILPTIDLFLSGHDHDMEHLIEAGQNFVVDGTSGRNLTSECSSSCIAGSQWHDDQHFGAVRLTVTPSSLKVEFIVLIGGVPTIEHSFTLTKTGPTPTPTPTPGSITGTVTDSVTRAAASAATVSYSGGSATTNASGVYSLSGVVSGTYTLSASLAGYTTQTASVTVTAGTTATQNFALLPLPGTITGTVSDPVTGVVISGATVSYSGGSALTSSSGIYTLNAVTEGSYSVTATATGYAAQAATVKVSPGATVAQNYALSPLPGNIQGQVLDGVTSKGIAGATVSYTVSGTTTSVASDANGRYTLANVGEGSYSVTAAMTAYASQALTVKVGPGASVTQNFTLSPSPGAIRGQVTDAVTLRAIPGASVSYTVSGTTTTVVTDAGGAYALSGVAEGSYTLTAAAAGFNGQSAAVTVGPGATVTQNFGLVPLPGKISGQVLDPVTARPIVGATVSSTAGSASTDGTGTYTIAGVGEGQYTVTASMTGYASQAVSVTVPPGATVTQNFSLAPLPGTINGQVRDSATGVGIPGASVSYPGGPPTSTTTDSGGNYTLTNITEGSYSLTAVATAYSSQTATVVVAPGASVTQNFTLVAQPGSIVGVISDAVTGVALGGAGVSIASGQPVATVSDAGGHYTLPGLPPGTYTVTASATGYTGLSGSAAVTSNTATMLNLALAPLPGGISGTLSDASTGAAIPNGTVSATGGSTVVSSSTDAAGHYAFSGLTEGTYSVTTGAAGYAVQTVAVAVAPGAAVVQSFNLAPLPGSVAGQVTDAATGSPMVGATVSTTVGTSPVSATTDQSGAYILANLPAGSYIVTASAATYVGQSVTVAVARNATTSQSFGLVGIPGSVAGQVTDGVTAAVIGGGTVTDGTRTATTDQSGGYTLSNVPAGTYTVTVSAPGYSGQSANVTVARSAQSVQPFALSPLPGSVSGQVTDAATSVGVPGASLTLQAGATSIAATSDAGGMYAFPTVAEGTYQLSATATGYGNSLVTVTVGPAQSLTRNLSLVKAPGSITGQVTDAVNGLAVPGALVSTAVGTSTVSVTSDATGTYTLTNLPPGSYSLTVTAAGFSSQSTIATVASNTATTQSFALAPLPGSLAGLVSDSLTAAPIPGATVAATMGATVVSATTDSSGRYTISNLAEGTYSLNASATGYTPQTGSVAVGPGAAVTASFSLAPLPGSIAGQVMDANTGLVIAGAAVSTNSGGTTITATTDVNGNYMLTNVAEGNRSVTATALGYMPQTVVVLVGPGASATQNFSAAPLPGSIGGSVTDASTGVGVGGATVTAIAGSTTLTATTSPDGSYLVSAVGEGVYTLTASASGYTAKSAPVSVGPGAGVAQSFSLAPLPATVGGRVTDSGTGLGVGGATVAMVQGSLTTTATADASGNYQFANLTEGAVTLTASAPLYAPQSASLVLAAGAAVTQNFALIATPGAVSGQVTDAVTLVAVANASVSTNAGGSPVIGTTDAHGSYTLANLPPGAYTVTASAAGYSPQSAAVTVSSGATAGQAFGLIPLPGTLSGQVIDGVTQTPIVGATISTSAGSTASGAGGAYQISGIGEGTYTVAAAMTGYAGQSQSVTIGPGASVTANFALAPLPGSISGQVTDANTALAIAGASVSTVSGGATITAATDVNGNYTLTNVTEGSRSLTTTASGYSTQTATVSLSPGGSATQNFALPPQPGSVSGRVQDSLTGLALVGASVTNGVGSTASTDGTGSYALAGLVEGSYVLTASQPGYVNQSVSVTVGPGAALTQPFALAPQPGAISGQVLDANTSRPISGASVSTMVGGLPVSTTTDATGAYTLGGLPEATYTVTAAATGYTSQAVAVTVRPGQTMSRAYALAPINGAISGKVTAAGTGLPIAGATVAYGGGSARSDASGNYGLTSVPPGSVAVTASALGFGSQTLTVMVVGGATTSQSFSLTATAVFSDGFEAGNFSQWNSSAGLAIETTTVHSGLDAAEGNTTTGATFATKTLPSTYLNLYSRIYFNLKSNTTNVSLLWLRKASGSIVHLYIDTHHRVALRNDVTLTTAQSGMIALNAWHSLEIHLIINGTSSTIEVWLDGVAATALNSTSANLGTAPIAVIYLGENNNGRTYDVIYDDVVVQTSRIGQ